MHKKIFLILILLPLWGCKEESDCSSSHAIDNVAEQLAHCLQNQEDVTNLLNQWGYPNESMMANLLPTSPDKELVISYRTSSTHHYNPRGKVAVLEYSNFNWHVVYESPPPQEKNVDDSHISLAGNWWFDLEQVGDVQGDGGEDVLFRLRWSNTTSISLAHAKLLTAPNDMIEVVTVEDSFHDHAPRYTLENGHIRAITSFGNGNGDAFTRILQWEDGRFVVSADIPNPTAATISVTMEDGTRYFTFDNECGWTCVHKYGLFRIREGEEPYAFGKSEYVRALKLLRDGNVYVGNNKILVVKRDQLVPTDFAPLPSDASVQIHDMAMTSNGEIWAVGYKLIHYGHETSTYHDFLAYSHTVTIAPDDSVWIDGWDGVADSNCCIYHIKNETVTSYQKDEISIPEFPQKPVD